MNEREKAVIRAARGVLDKNRRDPDGLVHLVQNSQYMALESAVRALDAPPPFEAESDRDQAFANLVARLVHEHYEGGHEMTAGAGGGAMKETKAQRAERLRWQRREILGHLSPEDRHVFNAYLKSLIAIEMEAAAERGVEAAVTYGGWTNADDLGKHVRAAILGRKP